MRNMKKMITAMLAVVFAVSLAACGGSSGGTALPAPTNTTDTVPEGDHTVLVAYFSGSGNTKGVAEKIAQATGADTFEMVPEEPYTSDDLNYNDKNSRVVKEHDDESLQDAVKLESTDVPNWDSYDVVFIGYPIWWQDAAWPVRDFVTSNDFTGKTVIPFCTSASSDIGDSGLNLASRAGTGSWMTGRRFTASASQDDIDDWATGLGLLASSSASPSTSASESGSATSSSTASASGRTALVAYFSASGHTEEVAEKIAQAADADTFEMIPEEPYSTADLTWTDEDSRVNKEHNDESLQDAVKLESTDVPNWDSYDVVFIGYPIWWGEAAWPVRDFVRSNDFTGKTVIPFCTSASSPIASSGTNLGKIAGTGDWQSGQRFSSSASADEVTQWVEGLGLGAATDTATASSPAVSSSAAD